MCQATNNKVMTENQHNNRKTATTSSTSDIYKMGATSLSRSTSPQLHGKQFLTTVSAQIRHHSGLERQLLLELQFFQGKNEHYSNKAVNRIYSKHLHFYNLSNSNKF